MNSLGKNQITLYSEKGALGKKMIVNHCAKAFSENLGSGRKLNNTVQN